MSGAGSVPLQELVQRLGSPALDEHETPAAAGLGSWSRTENDREPGEGLRAGAGVDPADPQHRAIEDRAPVTAA